MSDRRNKSLFQTDSKVLATPPADTGVAHNHFLSKLSFETDPSDVYHDIINKVSGIIVVDARTPETYARGHVPGAINLPHRTINSTTTASLPQDKLIVTYCDGVFCNASTKAAAKLTALGFKVKEMLDGMEGWRKEGYPIEETVMQVIAPASQ
ncbi:MAG TPA: rhodanese-like domain-containing protein [Candidatus Bathyarchaeia archaeon]|nr:rhodanese-like domain-containing protein [Candidatus Bathyarchaeia archaeon]